MVTPPKTTPSLFDTAQPGQAPPPTFAWSFEVPKVGWTRTCEPEETLCEGTLYETSKKAGELRARHFVLTRELLVRAKVYLGHSK